VKSAENPVVRMGLKWTLDRRKYLDSKEVKVLLRTLDREMKRGFQEENYLVVRNGFVILLGLYSGLRVAEMAALRNSDFEIYETCAFVRVRHGKGGKERLVSIGKELVKAFGQFTEFKRSKEISVDDEAFVICKENGCKPCLRVANRQNKGTKGQRSPGDDPTPAMDVHKTYPRVSFRCGAPCQALKA